MNKILFTLAVLFGSLMLTGCGDDPKLKVEANDLVLDAVNLTNGDKAVSGGVTVNVTTSITVNGETSVSVTKVNDELLVSPGDEIQITYKPGNGENEALLTFPDGEQKALTRSSSSCTWTVPQISSGNITAVSYSSDDDTVYTHKGTIKLVFDFNN